jgi:sugar lactone lactonase YvrE
VLVNDWSARDIQVPEMRQGLFGPMKSKNFATTMSAVVVTADEILDHLEDLRATVRVNGTIWATGSTAGMHHSLAAAVAYASLGVQLHPGELLATGTVPGCSGVEIGRWVGPGDEVRLEVGGIGTLTNVVGHPPLARQEMRGTVWHRPGVHVLPGTVPAPAPASWQPPDAPALEGEWAVNDLLDAAERWEVPGVGPEDVAFDSAGRMYAGLDDGRIVRWPPGGGEPEVIADTRGRPLGLVVDHEDRLIVCDSDRGLLRVPAPERVEVLCDAYEGRRLRFTNNPDIAADGTIYFSESSLRFGQTHYRQDAVEHRPNGSLFRFDPDTREVERVLDGLYFANGVALAADESFVLVAETYRYRVTRLWLQGDRAGRRDVFIENLPGWPDNMSRGDSGLFWLALPRPRDAFVDRLMPRARLRGRLFKVPERLQPDPPRNSMVVGLDEGGNVVHQLHGPGAVYGYVTGVREHEGWLYLGSLEEPAVARVPLPS